MGYTDPHCAESRPVARPSRFADNPRRYPRPLANLHRGCVKVDGNGVRTSTQGCFSGTMVSAMSSSTTARAYWKPEEETLARPALEALQLERLKRTVARVC